MEYKSPRTGTTPLHVVFTNEMYEVALLLVERGASVKTRNAAGMTPLFVASSIDNFEMMNILHQAERSHYPVNDGSLHVAARNCNLKAVKLLVSSGHDHDHPSDLHGGRTAIEELALNCAEADSDLVQPVAALLLELQAGQSPAVNNEKPLVLLALDNTYSSVAVTKALFRAGLYRDINSASNLYRANGHVYSPLSYLRKGLQQSPPEHSRALQQILRKCHEVYYRETDGDQPDDMVIATAPSDIQDDFRAQRRRKQFLREQQEDHEIAQAQRNDVLVAQEKQHQLTLRHAEESFSTQQDQKKRASGQKQMLLQQEAVLGRTLAWEQATMELTVAKDQEVQREKFAEHRRAAELENQRRLDRQRLATTTEEGRLLLENRKELRLQDQATTDARLNADRQRLRLERENQREIEASSSRQRQSEYDYAKRTQRLEIDTVNAKRDGVREQQNLIEAQRTLALTMQHVQHVQNSQRAIEYNYYSPD